jgi:agmatinase
MLAVLRRLGALRLVGADVVEVSPPYDHSDMTAIAGATVAMYVLGLLAQKQPG